MLSAQAGIPCSPGTRQRQNTGAHCCLRGRLALGGWQLHPHGWNASVDLCKHTMQLVRLQLRPTSIVGNCMHIIMILGSVYISKNFAVQSPPLDLIVLSYEMEPS